MLSLEEALERLLAAVRPIEGTETVSVSTAAGRILDQDVTAKSALPLFDNSAMDGWSVRSADVCNASQENPIVLRCVANVPAGGFFEGEIRAGECARIFTGSPLPAGADAVVMQEDTRAELPNVTVMEVAKPWENIRFRGEDVKQDAVLGREGDRVTARSAALLAACGVGEVKVKRVARIAILATGSELKEPGLTLRAGEIYESNRTLIGALVQQLGMEALVKEIVPDDLETTVTAIREASEADAIITCGGVSVGEYDFVQSAIKALGGSMDFWRVAIKPGKPFLHANVLGKPLFGLPGNPVSALVTFWLLARPTLLRLAGATDVMPSVSFGRLAEAFSNPGDRRHFLRVAVDADGNVHASGPQASHRLRSLAAANALLDLPPETTWELGRMVKLILLNE